VAFGIALVTTLAGSVQLTVAVVLLRRRIGPLDGRRIVTTFARSLVALVIPVIAGVLLLVTLGGTHAAGFALSSKFSAIVSMAIIGTVMTLLYFAGLWLLRSPEFRGFAAPMLGRVRRR
jgi:putative peptidoglycan lipid II flippase